MLSYIFLNLTKNSAEFMVANSFVWNLKEVKMCSKEEILTIVFAFSVN